MSAIVFETSPYYDYVVYRNGNITKILRGENKVETKMRRYEDTGGIFVWIGRRKHYVKSLVARYFNLKDYRKGCVISHKDGDSQNCAFANLYCEPRDNSKDSRSYTKVAIDGVEYDSIAAAERALFISHGYLTKYFKGQVSGKILGDHDVKLVVEE